MNIHLLPECQHRPNAPVETPIRHRTASPALPCPETDRFTAPINAALLAQLPMFFSETNCRSDRIIAEYSTVNFSASADSRLLRQRCAGPFVRAPGKLALRRMNQENRGCLMPDGCWQPVTMRTTEQRNYKGRPLAGPTTYSKASLILWDEAAKANHFLFTFFGRRTSSLFFSSPSLFGMINEYPPLTPFGAETDSYIISRFSYPLYLMVISCPQWSTEEMVCIHL